MEFWSTIIGAVIGGIIGIIGSFIGGKYSYKGSMDAVVKQIEIEQNKLVVEQKEKSDLFKKSIKFYLEDEIKYNFNRLLRFSTNNENDLFKHFDSDMHPNINYSYSLSDEMDFRFDEFNLLKVEFLNLSCEDNKEIINIYKMFKLLHYHKTFNNMTKEDYEYVKNTFNTYYNKYKK